MNLRKKVTEGVVVAISLIMMSAVAASAGVGTDNTVNEAVAKNNEYASSNNGTAGVVASLDQTWNETIKSIETEADIEKADISLVALSEDAAYYPYDETGESGADDEAEELTEEELEWQNRLMADVEDFLYVRESGDQDAEIVGKLTKGAVAEVVETGDTWTHIISGNVDGYVNNDYCVYGLDALDYAKENVETTATVLTNGLRLRSSADLNASVLKAVSQGTTLDVDTDEETPEDWVAVTYNGSTAYVSAEYVETALDLTEGITVEEEAAAIAAQKAAEEAAAQKAAEEKAAKEAAAAAAAAQNEAVASSVGDVVLLAALIQAEAGNECYEGQVAVGAVVMNRVRSGGYPSSIYGVIYQKSQFPPAASGTVARIASNGPKASCIQAAQEAINGVDNTGGAHGFARASSGRAGVVIGNHVFY
jgi:uncharacterized protein YgiM (DUF1202 family)